MDKQKFLNAAMKSDVALTQALQSVERARVVVRSCSSCFRTIAPAPAPAPASANYLASTSSASLACDTAKTAEKGDM